MSNRPSSAASVLEDSEARYRALFEQSPMGVFTFDRDLRLTDCNLAFVRLLRSTYETLIGLNLRTLNDLRILPAVERVLEGEPLYFEGPYVAQLSDAEIEVATWITPLRDADGEVTGGLGLVEDVTARRAAQKALARSEANFRALIAGVAHEINNPLAYVMANLEVLARHSLPEMTKLASSDAERERIGKMSEMVDQVRHGAERMKRIVGDVRTFARGDDDSLEPVDVGAVLDAALQLVALDLRRRGHLVREFAPVAKVAASESRLGQVFVNVLMNALQALPETGDQEVRVRVSAPAVGWVLVEVSDTGEGIPADVLPRIFEPFFTTKPVGVGTGLGLFVSQGIVTSLGGTLDVQSERGRGTTVSVRLPAAIPAAS